MVSVIGLDAEKVAELCEAANAEVSEEERVQIANFLCPVCKKLPYSHFMLQAYQPATICSYRRCVAKLRYSLPIMV